jgi:hypothetical protein
MVENMHCIVIGPNKITMQKVKYIVVYCDEVTIIDNQSWCSVHVYVNDDFDRMSLLLNLEGVITGGNANNLT